MQTTHEEYKEWTEDGTVESTVQMLYDKAKEKAEKVMVYENGLVVIVYFWEMLRDKLKNPF